MASLRKQKASNVWYAQFYVKDSKSGALIQVRKSTGETNKSKAKARAVDLERAGRGTIAAGSDEARLAKAIIAEMQIELEQGRFTAAAARNHLARLVTIATATGEQLPSFTLEMWVAEWLRRKERNSSKSTMARYKGHAGAFLSWMGTERRKKPLESVTGQDARKWREELQNEGRAGKTVLAYMKDAGSIYRGAIAEGLISFNPFTSLDSLDTSDSQERKPFTPSEVARLMSAAPCEEWHGLILVAVLTGLRLGDASKLSWSSVDIQAKLITLIPSKTKRKKREVRIPIHPDLLAFFESVHVRSDSPTAPVFSKLAKSSIGAGTGLSQTFNKIMSLAGVDRGKPSRDTAVTGTVGRVTYERGFHSLRHSFTSWLRDADVSEEDRMALTGHSTRESHQIYSHASEKAGQVAIAKLPSLTQAKP
jgi:integrase